MSAGHFRRASPIQNRATGIRRRHRRGPYAASGYIGKRVKRCKSGFFTGHPETPGPVGGKLRDSDAGRHFTPPHLKREAFYMAVKEKIRIRVKGYDHSLVDQSAEKIVETAKRTGARVSGPIPLPTEKEIVTILRAVHKYKDSREQFESRTHKRLIDILRPSNKTVEALMGLELPAGVEIEIKL